MTRTGMGVLAAAMLALCAGCIQSLHPLHTEKDVVFEPALVGEWAEEGSDQVWKFSKGDSNFYKLLLIDEKGERGEFAVHLLKIGGKLFLDFYPEEPDLKAADFYMAHLFPVHTIAHVEQIEPELRMAFPKLGWLEKLVEKDPGAIKHERVDDQILLTASTSELQKFWVKHLDSGGAFGKADAMKRRAGE